MVENICALYSPGHDPLYLAGSRVSLQHSPPWNVPALTICSGSCEEPFFADVHVLSHFGASGHLTTCSSRWQLPCCGVERSGKPGSGLFSARRPFGEGVWAASLDPASLRPSALCSLSHVRNLPLNLRGEKDSHRSLPGEAPLSPVWSWGGRFGQQFLADGEQ